MLDGVEQEAAKASTAANKATLRVFFISEILVKMHKAHKYTNFLAIFATLNTYKDVRKPQRET